MNVTQYLVGALQEDVEVVLVGRRVKGCVLVVPGKGVSATYFYNTSSVVVKHDYVVDCVLAPGNVYMLAVTIPV